MTGSSSPPWRAVASRVARTAAMAMTSICAPDEPILAEARSTMRRAMASSLSWLSWCR